MAPKKTISYSLYALLSIIVFLTAVYFFSAQNEKNKQEKATAEAEARKQEAIAANLAELARIQDYQRYCSATVSRIEAASDFVKLVSATGSAVQYFRGTTSIPCAARTSSTDCTLVRSLTFNEAYVCPSEPIATAANDSNGIQARTQTTGNAVILETVVLEAPGFVVISSTDRSKKPADALAQSPLLPAGAWKIVSVAMPKSLVVGTTYAVTLYTDNGDGVFDAKTDTRITSGDGSPLMVTFTAVKEKK